MKTRLGKEIWRRLFAVLHFQNANPFPVRRSVMRFIANGRARFAAVALGEIDHHYPFPAWHSDAHFRVAYRPAFMEMRH
jgi:hypothetical protein